VQNVWKEAFGKPIWWLLSNALWTGLCVAGRYLLDTRGWLDWLGWVLFGIAAITLVFGMAAAQRIVDRQESTHQTQIAHLKTQLQNEWEEKLKKLREEQEERDLPEMIALIDKASNEHRKSLNIFNPGYKAPLDWILSQFPKSSERIVRKAFAQWHGD
jgi:hypothetical protein